VKRIIYAESCGDVSVLLSNDVCDKTYISVNIRLKPSTFLLELGPLVLIITLTVKNIVYISQVKYLSVIFWKRIVWRLHIELIETKAYTTFINI
jgi:hypothetical protein